MADLGEEFARDGEPVALRGWWLYAMLNGGHPLREKLTLFWHNHFATSIAKVQSVQLMYVQNRVLRTHALAYPDTTEEFPWGHRTMKVRGNELQFTAQRYLLQFSLPNFFFHVTTAYALLRHGGVDIGKQDYLAGSLLK